MDQDAEVTYAYVYLKLGITNRWPLLLMEIDTLY